jgi:hypothetical protein
LSVGLARLTFADDECGALALDDAIGRSPRLFV